MQKVSAVVIDAVDLLGTRCLVVFSDISSVLILVAVPGSKYTFPDFVQLFSV